MELRHLRYFVTVAEELHFGRAAERLQLAHQPLSVQIRRLEAELGVTLFTRTTRQVALTEAGRVFLEKAQQILQLVEQAIDIARETARGERGQLVIGYISTTLYNVLPPLLRSFREAFPHIHVILRELCSPELDELVMQGDLDIGLIGRPIRDDGLACLPLCREPFVVVIPKNHRLATFAEIPFRELDNEPFIQYDRVQKRQVHDAVVTYFHNEGVGLNVVQEVTTEQALIGLAAAGMGISFVAASLSGLRQGEVEYRRLIETPAEVEYNLIWRREMPSSVIRSFLKIAQIQPFMKTADLSV